MFKPNRRRPTIRDVAKEAGVSPATVSHALTGRGHVDPRTSERIHEVVRQLGYRPNIRAQRLRTGEPQLIALVSSMPFEVAGWPSRCGFIMDLAAMAATSALKLGLALVVVPPVDTATLPIESLDIDGAIVIEPSSEDPAINSMISRNLPVVSIGRHMSSNSVPYVDLQAPYTTMLNLEHLKECGAKKIAILIGDAKRSSHMEAEEAYLKFCAENSMQASVIKLNESGGEEEAIIATKKLFLEHPDIDGIYTTIDAFATGALKAIADLGKKVPDDVKVSTRYNGLRARKSNPPLTAVELNLGELASLGVQLLLATISGNNISWPLKAADKPFLVTSLSTGK